MPNSSPDFLFAGVPLTGGLHEEGILDGAMTSKQVRQALEDDGRGDAKDVNSKALAEVVDKYPPRVYDRFSDKRFMTVVE